jgi:hypothetical protein
VSPFPATNPQAGTNCICESSRRWYSLPPVGGDDARETDTAFVRMPDLRGSAVNLRTLSALSCAAVSRDRHRPSAESQGIGQANGLSIGEDSLLRWLGCAGGSTRSDERRRIRANPALTAASQAGDLGGPARPGGGRPASRSAAGRDLAAAQ